MLFHPQKCKVMHLGTNNPLRAYHMETCDGNAHPLEAVDEEKDLGVIIDKDLTFSKHISKQVNKANQVLGAIKHTFSALDNTTFLLLYKSLVRPHLECATVIWNPRYKRDKDALERIQRRATKLLKGLSELSYGERLRALNLPTLEYRRQRADIIETFKILKGLDHAVCDRECKTCGNCLVKNSIYKSTRGHSMKLHAQHHPGIREHFFVSRVTSTWKKPKHC